MSNSTTQQQFTLGPQGDNGLALVGNRSRIGDNSSGATGRDVTGEGNIVIGAGATFVENLNDELAQSTVNLSRFLTDRGFTLADSTLGRGFDFANAQAELAAERESRAFDFVDAQTRLTESTREGNQQITADLARRAFDLAEKRTGSDSDRAQDTVSSLVKWGAVAAAIVALAALFRPRKAQ